MDSSFCASLLQFCQGGLLAIGAGKCIILAGVIGNNKAVVDCLHKVVLPSNSSTECDRATAETPQLIIRCIYLA